MNSELHAPDRVVNESDADYPKELRELRDAPPVLYIKGRWPLSESCRIGIVGTRRATPYGLDVAERFAQTFVRRGAATVSGLAAGIDACAHRVTLEEGGWTIAVLGHGLGHQYPRQNAGLFREIGNRGTLLTEFPHDTPPQPRYFPQRNRIISGLSRGIVVVEAGEKSGALITARYAAEQGKDVYVVPGSIFSPFSVGGHRLIKEGASLVDSPEDVLQAYGLEDPYRSQKSDPWESNKNSGKEELTSGEKEALKLLSSVPMSVDELVELSGRPVDCLAEHLLSLELKGIIRHLPGQRYVATH